MDWWDFGRHAKKKWLLRGGEGLPKMNQRKRGEGVKRNSEIRCGKIEGGKVDYEFSFDLENTFFGETVCNKLKLVLA